MPPITTHTPTTAERAAAALQAGNYAQAQQLAEAAIADDYVNALAQTVLARLGWRVSDWNGVVEHLSIVRTRRRLSNEENAEYYVSMLRSGRLLDAEGVRRTLPNAVMTMPIVAQTIAAMQRPAPQPAPAPAPRPQPAPVPISPPPPAPQPVVRQPQMVSPQPAPPSPLVAIARHQPSEAATVHNVATALVEADRMLREGRIANAREAYLRLTFEPPVSRELSLEIAKGLNRTSAFRASSIQYQKLYPLKHGEETHMLYEAENRYELGDLDTARQILSAALPFLPKSQEVELYRGKIQGRR
jgi:tetratricopeptide (TPR) repeat protein